MAIKPILFSTPMVQAIRRGDKSVTRRIVTERIIEKYEDYDEWCNAVMPRDIPGRRSYEKDFFMQNAPYRPGDILWVRETWCDLPVLPNGSIGSGAYFYYKADGDSRPEGWRGNWKPPIFMPKSAARIFLRVKDVRVERLQSIDNAGALSEGCDGRCLAPSGGTGSASISCKSLDFSVEKFIDVWESTLRPKDREKYGWFANPLVWVIEFERCEKPENF